MTTFAVAIASIAVRVAASSFPTMRVLEGMARSRAQSSACLEVKAELISAPKPVWYSSPSGRMGFDPASGLKAVAGGGGGSGLGSEAAGGSGVAGVASSASPVQNTRAPVPARVV